MFRKDLGGRAAKTEWAELERTVNELQQLLLVDRVGQVGPIEEFSDVPTSGGHTTDLSQGPTLNPIHVANDRLRWEGRNRIEVRESMTRDSTKRNCLSSQL